MPKILIVDDERSIRDSFSLILEGKYKVLTAASGEGAIKQIADQKVDLAYLDIRMPGMDGLETLKKMKQIDPDLEIVMVTAVNEVQKASEAIKIGARDYLVKPFDVEAIIKMTEQILRRKALAREVEKEASENKVQLIGQNEKIIGINKLIDKISAKDLRVLIVGEAGTEKELVARSIHYKSPRANAPFKILNLSSDMSAARIINRLVGAGRGSTIIDLEKNINLLEEARGGTLFINNLELLPSIPDSFQESNVRLIAGSSLDHLEEKAREQYNYFSEVMLSLPPLRERISDLPLLINNLIEQLNQKYAKEIKGLTPEVENIFSNYLWPGNFAELSALMEKLIVNATSEQIRLESLPVDLLLMGAQPYGSDYSALFEKALAAKAVKACDSHKEAAASMLGVNPSYLGDLLNA
jgi:DNA-binding NtrC family response regulator